MEALKKALAEAKERAAKERTTREMHEAKIGEVQQELQDVVNKYESLERQNADQESELVRVRQSAQEARAEAQGTLQEIQEAKKIPAGKAFIMQSKYVMTWIWSSPGAFVDLPHIISDATAFF